jgi:NTP pyrophosphatase (non-canonical NTP hydrolase)
VKDLETLRQTVAAFVAERDWEQFHSPKNLAMALTVEAAELQEQFQWLTLEQAEALDDDQREAVADEMADVLVYLVRLADRLDVDLLEAAERKMAKNRAKYPAEQVRGKAVKYTELE